MTMLNKRAASIASECDGVHAMTDVTGFGLMGHGRELAMASNVTLEIEVDKVPTLAGALEAVGLGAIPGGLISNREYAECTVSDDVARPIDPALRTLLFDPQTSGGLLISVGPDHAERMSGLLIDAGVPAVSIGRVREGKPGIILR
jgi:selenide,water dikinase